MADITRFPKPPEEQDALGVQAPIQIDPRLAALSQMNRKVVSRTEGMSPEDYAAAAQEAQWVNQNAPLMQQEQVRGQTDEANLLKLLANRPTPVDYSPMAAYFDTHFGNSPSKGTSGYKYTGSNFNEDLNQRQALLQQLAARRTQAANSERENLLKALQSRRDSRAKITETEVEDPAKAFKALQAPRAAGAKEDKEEQRQVEKSEKKHDVLVDVESALIGAKKYNALVKDSNYALGKVGDKVGMGGLIRDDNSDRLNIYHTTLSKMIAKAIEKSRLTDKDQAFYDKVTGGKWGDTKRERAEVYDWAEKQLKQAKKDFSTQYPRAQQRYDRGAPPKESSSGFKIGDTRKDKAGNVYVYQGDDAWAPAE